MEKSAKERIDAVDTISMSHIRSLIMDALHGDPNSQIEQILSNIEKKTGLKREQIVYVVIGVACIYMIFGAFAEIVCNVLGFGYPAYASVKAIRTQSKDDDTHWLMYWTVFALFSLVDFFAEKILSFFPIYWVAKALFLVYLYLPQTRGTVALYGRFVDPTINAVDKMMAKYLCDKKA